MPDIDFQKIELNLIPKKGDEPVIFYASQYETARPFIADLMWGETEFAPGVDCYAEIDIRKNDDNLVVITDDVSIDNNEVSVILPIQALTCIGKNLGQVKIYAADDQLIAALNFILEVQPDPLAGGVTSESAIDNLETQIAAVVSEVIGDDYYNKTETDALLADKADKSELPDMNDYYTKSTIDSNFYTKSQVDYKLDDYALKSWVSSNFINGTYLNNNYYNKTTVDSMLYNMLPTITASGAVATFNTERTGALVSCTVDPLANTVTHCGVAMWDEQWRNGYYNIDGTFSSYAGCIANKNMIHVNPNTAYYFKSNGGNFGRVCWYDRDGIFISSDVPGVSAVSITSPNDAYYLNFDMTSAYGDTYNNDISVNYPATDTFYHAYNGTEYPVADVDQITTFNGVNNIFADVGDITVQAKDSIQHYIDERT